MLAELLLQLGLVVYVAASIGLLLYGLNAYVLVVMMFRHRRAATTPNDGVRTATEPADGALPMVTTQLPIFNEKHVVERLLLAACALDYPRDRHEIQVLDDSTDETSTLAVDLVAGLQAAGHDIRHIRRGHRRGYKAGALAEGLLAAKGEFVAIFDADFVPPPDFLRATIPHLAKHPRCCFVQTRWGHLNRSYSLLTELQSIGIDGHFVIEQAARAWNGLFFNFNGTAGVWRASAIVDAGGWTSDTLTEDLDLSYRAQLRGWRPHYLQDYVTPAELPTDINAFKAQQRRWATGSIQCAIKLLPRVLRSPELGVFAKMQSVLHLTHYLIHPLILTLTLLVLPLVLGRGVVFADSLTVPLVAVMLIALCGPSTLYIASQAVSGGRWIRTALLMPLLVGVGIGLALNNTLAVVEALRRRSGGEFVRTPKLGALAQRAANADGAHCARVRSPGYAGDYHAVRDKTCLGELLLGVWALAACVVFMVAVGVSGGLLLAVQAGGFAAVGVLSARHGRRRMPAEFAPRSS
jgi:cellulose synthase/poly-beta-1,6-N-acetylglucosamine synthase-like glycosyltransferase